MKDGHVRRDEGQPEVAIRAAGDAVWEAGKVAEERVGGPRLRSARGAATGGDDVAMGKGET